MRRFLLGWLVALGCSDGPPAAPEFAWRAGERSFSTNGGGLTARWEAGAVHVGAVTFGSARLEREGWGAPGVASAASVTGSLLQARRGEVVEEWLHSPVGLEVRWRFTRAPGGRGDLTVAVPIGSASVEDGSGGVIVSSATSELAVSHGTFIDATGRRTPVLARAGGGSVTWVVPATVLRDAIWPAVLDPLIQPDPFNDREMIGAVPHPAKQRSSASGGLPSDGWVVVWEDERVKPGSTDIFGVTGPDGQGVFRVSRSGQAREPDIAVRGDGSWLVVWSEPSRVVGALGPGPTFEPFTIATGVVLGPARVAATTEGFFVVWSRGLRIDGARVSTGGGVASSLFTIAQTPGDSPAVSAIGDTVSVIFETPGGSQLVQGQIQGAAPIIWLPRPLPMPNAGGRRPAVLATPREVFVGWQFASPDGSAIEAYRLTDGGLPNRLQVASTPGDDETGVSFSALADGSLLAGWSRRREGRVRTRVIDGGSNFDSVREGREGRLSPTRGDLSWTHEEDIKFEERDGRASRVVSFGSEVQDQPAVAISDAGSIIAWAARSTSQLRYRAQYSPNAGAGLRVLIVDAGVPHLGLAPGVAMAPTGLALLALPTRRALELELHGPGGVVDRGTIDGGWGNPSVAWLGNRWAVAAEIEGLGVAIALGPPDGGVPSRFGPVELDSTQPRVLPSFSSNQVGLLSRVDVNRRLVVGAFEQSGAVMMPVVLLAFPVQSYQLVPHGAGIAVASLGLSRDLTVRVHLPPVLVPGPAWSPPGLLPVLSFAIASDGVSAPVLWTEALPDGGEVVWATRLFPDGGTRPGVIGQGEAERDLAIACSGRTCSHARASWTEAAMSTRLTGATVVTNEPPLPGATSFTVEVSGTIQSALAAIDRDGDRIAYRLPVAPAAGLVSLLPDPAIRYDAPATPGTYTAQLTLDDGYGPVQTALTFTVVARVDGGAGTVDASVFDPDAGVDAGAPDLDAGSSDAGPGPDGGGDGGSRPPDGGSVELDAGMPPDGGALEERFVPVSCGCGTVEAAPWLLAGALVIGRRRRMKPPAV